MDKNTLHYFLEADKIALGRALKYPKFHDQIWKFQILLRKCEYYDIRKSINLFARFSFYFYRYKYYKKGLLLGFSIPLHVFGPGLCIVHYGSIIINRNSKIGNNCRIHSGVNIGATGGSNKAPPNW